MIDWPAALQPMPDDAREAAMIDGAGPGREFRHITLPLLIPFLVIITLIDTVGALNVFDLMYTLTSMFHRAGERGRPARLPAFGCWFWHPGMTVGRSVGRGSPGFR